MKYPSRLLLLSLCLSFSSLPAFALTLDEYLNQVQLNNEGVRGAKLGSSAKELRLSEASLLFKPSFFLTGQYSNDKRPTNSEAFQGNQTINEFYSMGLSQNFRTGTKATLSYNFSRTQINGAGPILERDKFFDSYPKIELSQSLWRNWLGSEVKAQETVQLAQVEAARLNDIFTLKQLLVRAENAYWRLFYAEQALKVQKESLDRAKKLRDWNASRLRNNLVDEADYLQAEANLQNRELELETALIELNTAKREFNSIRQSTEEVTLINEMPDRDVLRYLKLPERAGVREDVQIAIANQKSAAASAALGIERNKPNLEVFGNYSLNGRGERYSQAWDQASDGTRPWTVVGLRFSTPLDFGSLSDYRKGYAQEKAAADLNSRRKVYEVDREWEILSQRFEDFKKRLNISKRMEDVQLKKLTAEKKRYNQGRSTTFQVLTFEQDAANAQLLRIRNELELVNVHNQLKLFSGVSNE